MQFKNSIIKTLGTALMLLFPVFCVNSCRKTEEAPVELKLRTEVASARSGQQFLDIQVDPNLSWTLEVRTSDQSGEVDWVWFEPFIKTADDVNENEVTVISSDMVHGQAVTLHYAENHSSQKRQCTVVLSCGKSVSSCVFTQNGATSVIETPDDFNTSTALPMWLELPAAYDDDHRHFVTHSMNLRDNKGQSVTFRNYSMDFDEDEMIAAWVAYPLNSWTISSGTGRTNAWGLDPKIPRDKQPVIFNAFGNSGSYARGHQIPSADRYADGANQQTFYGSNMTPQMHSFNSNIWATLEGHVRTKSKAFDTLYVVTGCYTGKTLGKCRDNDGKQITIPGGYYKALLGFSRSEVASGSTVKGGSGNYAGYYIGVGYYFDHQSYPNTKQEVDAHRMSIDALESITGEDFFPNLVTILGSSEQAAMVERQNASFWNLN